MEHFTELPAREFWLFLNTALPSVCPTTPYAQVYGVHIPKYTFCCKASAIISAHNYPYHLHFCLLCYATILKSVQNYRPSWGKNEMGIAQNSMPQRKWSARKEGNNTISMLGKGKRMAQK